MKRILVTGATGGLGRNAVRMLLGQGVQVRATGRNGSVGEQLAASGAHFMALDLARSSPHDLRQLMHGVDAVWHCAALSAPWGRTADFIDANVTVTRRLLQSAAEHGVKRFVHVSTPAIYFDYRDRYDVPETFRPAAYVNAYAQTKAQAEDLVQQAVEQHPDMRCVILRPRAIFGPHDQVLIPRLARVLRERHGKLPLPKGGAVRIDITYVDNVVHALWLATVNPKLASGSVFNITNHEPALLGELLQSLFRDALQQPFEIVSLPYPLLAGAARCLQFAARFTGKEPSLTPYSVGAISYDMTLDNTRARQVLGYRPVVSLAEGVRRTAEWMKKTGALLG